MFNKSQPSPAAAAVLRQAAGNGNPEPSATAVGAAPASAAGSTVIPLSKPIATHKGTVSEIVIRPPTFTDYIQIGDIDTPVISGKADGDPGQDVSVVVRTNYAAIMRWASALTGLDQIVLSQLAPHDAGLLMRHVRLALAPFQQGNSPAAPTS